MPLNILYEDPYCLQEERSQCLWQALERFIPDVRDRAELTLTGTPLTHERFLNRHKGTYGAAISAASGSFPGPQTPIPGLYRWEYLSSCKFSLRLHAMGLCLSARQAHQGHCRPLSPELPAALLGCQPPHLVCSGADPFCTIQLEARPL